MSELSPWWLGLSFCSEIVDLCARCFRIIPLSSGVCRMSNFFLVAKITSKIAVEILQVYCLNPRSTSR